jgi:hypothetical protein
MNWGYKLTLAFIGFAALIGTLVYKAVNTRYELVSKDYYNEELRYQEKIDGMNNAAQAGDIVLARNGQSIVLTLPASLHNSANTANAWFYCKTNAASDKKLSVVFTDGTAAINTGNFAKESYELKLQLTADNKPYYFTQPLDLR